ncbi:MAG: hypothetical protein KAU28_09140, partial [Phycisphaerae bacterium]|nr:hypothetical protein [Phycisphaerae bacterium]
VLVINMIAQKEENYIRKDVELLGRYGLSDRTKKIASSVSSPIRVTCVYTATDEQTGSLYRPRLLEMLTEMREQNRNIEIINTTNDTGKAELVGRLRRRLGGQAPKHVALLDEFERQVKPLARIFGEQEQTYRALAGKSYLDVWGLTPELARLFGGLARDLEGIGEKVSRATRAGLADYAALTDELKDKLESTRQSLENVTGLLERIGKLPEAVSRNRKDVLKSIDEALEAVRSMAKVVGSPDDPTPGSPAAVLKKFIAATDKARAKATAAADALDGIAGRDGANLVRNSRYMQVSTAGMNLPLSDFYRVLAAGRLEAQKKDAQGFLDNATSEAQLKLIKELRTGGADLVELFEYAKQIAAPAMEKLVEVDETTRDILSRSADGKLLAPMLAPIAELLNEAGKLPELKSSALSSDIAEDNVVVIEAGGKVEVVRFEDVWPPKVESLGALDTDKDKDTKRIFNGGPAISSRILKMTHEPFGTVLIAYFEPTVPPQMARMMPRDAVNIGALNALRRRLQEANFRVDQWNLAEDMPAAE